METLSNMNIILMALITTVLTVAVLAANKVMHGRSITNTLTSALFHFVLSFLVYAGLLYFFLPPLTGLIGGYGWLLVF